MPASRWHSNINDLFQWIGEEDEEIISMMMSSMFSQFNKSDSNLSDPNAAQISNSTKYPEVLPILPLDRSQRRAAPGVHGDARVDPTFRATPDVFGLGTAQRPRLRLRV